ncbi:MAG TPA: phytanoyl-CoA dioxygenase family protein [Armatimonadaceae bacterium]|nr:phytanoyl-CoA dioxygenase family protein [Armatimonadaceae bacterium]
MGIATAERAAVPGANANLTPEYLAGLKEQFDRDGYAVVRGLFSPAEVAEIRETFMAQAAGGPIEGLSDGHWQNCDPSDPLKFYPRMMHPHLHADKPVGPLSMRYMLDRRVETVLAALMGEAPIAAQSMFYFKPAGARGQDLHQDNFYLRVKPGTCYAAWVAVDDVDEENGGMMLVPGSHLLDIACPQKSDPTISFTDAHVPVPEGMSTAPANMKAGDCLFFNGSVIHGSYPNRSADRFRRSFICHYLPRASEELARFYQTFTFDGKHVEIPPATGGGPCGVPHEATGPH